MSDLRVEADGPILRLTIDREQRRNALNDPVLRGMIAAVREPGDARVILVTGAGDKVFCAGADLSLMSEEATGLERHEARGGLRELMIAMRRCPLPVVARVQGLCLAGGVGLALGCDLVVASEAAEFGLPEVNLGLWPFMVSVLLARHCSPKLALDLMMSGRRLPAREAAAAGFVSRLVPAENLDSVVETLAGELAAKPPVAVRLGKAAFAAVEETSYEAALEAMQGQLSLITQTGDAAEGVAAFFQKRPPQWSGR